MSATPRDIVAAPAPGLAGDADAASVAAAVRGIASMATARALLELAAQPASAHAVRIDIATVGGIVAAERVAAGESFDFVVLAADAIDALASGGHVDAASRVPLCESSIALAVAPGLPIPVIASADDVRALLLDAPRIAYSTGPSGRHLIALLEHWGMTHDVAPRLVRAAPGVGVGTLLARGDADVGVQQMSELMPIEGIGIAGELPRAIQQITTFTAAVCTAAAQPAAAAEALARFASADSAATWRRHGLVPLG